MSGSHDREKMKRRFSAMTEKHPPDSRPDTVSKSQTLSKSSLKSLIVAAKFRIVDGTVVALPALIAVRHK
jgi:hypothetical protein